MSNSQANDGNKPDLPSDLAFNSPTTLEESQDKLPTIIGKAKPYFAD